MQSQLLFKGSGFFLVAPDNKGSISHSIVSVSQSAASEAKSDAVSNTTDAQPTDDSAEKSKDAAVQCWRVVYVLADDDLTALARRGLW